MAFKDLGLSYEEAAHAMQSSVAHEMNLPHRQAPTEPKHLRVGVNTAMVDHAALAYLLIQKGIIRMDQKAPQAAPPGATLPPPSHFAPKARQRRRDGLTGP